jgi:hypothetical protein
MQAQIGPGFYEPNSAQFTYRIQAWLKRNFYSTSQTSDIANKKSEYLIY